MKDSKKAFTLVEVIISLVIVSLAMITLSSGMGLAAHSSRKSKLLTNAALAAKNLMTDVDILVETRGYKYFVAQDKKLEKDFEDERYKGWKWKREIKEVEFPIATIIKTLSKKSNDEDDAQSKIDNAQEDAFLGLMATNIEKLMKDSIREVSITVSWPVRAGKAFDNYTIVYYVVDYDAVGKFSPSF